MGSTWVLSAPDGPHFVPMNLIIRASYKTCLTPFVCAFDNFRRWVIYSTHLAMISCMSSKSTHLRKFPKLPNLISWISPDIHQHILGNDTWCGDIGLRDNNESRPPVVVVLYITLIRVRSCMKLLWNIKLTSKRNHDLFRLRNNLEHWLTEYPLIIYECRYLLCFVERKLHSIIVQFVIDHLWVINCYWAMQWVWPIKHLRTSIHVKYQTCSRCTSV